MVMAIKLLADSTRIHIAAGYESGHTMVFVQNDPGAPFQKLYAAQPHTQPGQLLQAPTLTHRLTPQQCFQ